MILLVAGFSDDLRRETANRIRDGLRSVGRPPKEPSRWQPHRVSDPETGKPFAAEAAWDFIADHIEQGHPIKSMTLNQPPGAHAYVMKIPLPEGKPLYVKFQLGDYVVGRSFHISEY